MGRRVFTAMLPGVSLPPYLSTMTMAAYEIQIGGHTVVGGGGYIVSFLNGLVIYAALVTYLHGKLTSKTYTYYNLISDN